MFKIHVAPHASHASLAEVTSIFHPFQLEFPPKSNKWKNDPILWRLDVAVGVLTLLMARHPPDFAWDIVFLLL
jgi:hypothetical protein